MLRKVGLKPKSFQLNQKIANGVSSKTSLVGFSQIKLGARKTFSSSTLKGSKQFTHALKNSSLSPFKNRALSLPPSRKQFSIKNAAPAFKFSPIPHHSLKMAVNPLLLSAPAQTRFLSSQTSHGYRTKAVLSLPQASTGSSYWSQYNGQLLILAGLAGLFALASSSDAEAAETEVNYDKVRKEIADIVNKNPNYDDGSYGPLFVRLAWHASGTYDKETNTGGSNGATMRYALEANDGANAGLALARELLEPVMKNHPGLTYSDLWTLAGGVAIEGLFIKNL